MTDEELMLEAKAGEMQCISILFDRYHKRLYNFFYQQTHDRSRSEDLTQNVFERLIKYKDRYVQKDRFTPWIYTIARNVHKDLYRKKREDLPGDEKVHYLVESSDQNEGADPQAEEKDQLKKALNNLKIDQRELIWLSRYERMKYAEIAQMMGTTEGAIKAKIHRTMKDLKIEFFKIRAHELGK